MNIAVDVCFEQIFRAFEQVILPEIKSDFARGQFFCAMELLNQMEPHIGYRQSLLVENYDCAREALQIVLEALTRSGVALPETMKVPQGLGAQAQGADAHELPALVSRTEEQLSAALNLIHQHRDRIDDGAAVEKKVLSVIRRRVERDVALMKPSYAERTMQTGTGGK